MKPEDEEALRSIAAMISDYRREAVECLAQGVVDECEKIASTGYDPARGRGRGPWWAEGE